MEDKKIYLVAILDEETQARLAGYYELLRENGLIGKQTKGVPYHITLGDLPPECEAGITAEAERVCAEREPIDLSENRPYRIVRAKCAVP